MHANIQEQLRSSVETGALHSIWNPHFDCVKGRVKADSIWRTTWLHNLQFWKSLFAQLQIRLSFLPTQ